MIKVNSKVIIPYGTSANFHVEIPVGSKNTNENERTNTTGTIK
jgi:hypothetical protein